MIEKLEPAGIHKPVGGYCHAARVSAKQLVFVAGQVPVDRDGNIVGIDPNEKLDAQRRNLSHIDLSAQVRQTMLNLKAALEASGASIKDLVRIDTYIVVSAMNEWRTTGRQVKHELLEGTHVPGATVFVAGLMIPEALIEVSAIAAID